MMEIGRTVEKVYLISTVSVSSFSSDLNIIFSMVSCYNPVALLTIPFLSELQKNACFTLQHYYFDVPYL